MHPFLFALTTIHQRKPVSEWYDGGGLLRPSTLSNRSGSKCVYIVTSAHTHVPRVVIVGDSDSDSNSDSDSDRDSDSESEWE